MIQTRMGFVRAGVVRPAASEWRVRIVFLDGSDRVVRMGGRVSEETAVRRALLYAKVFDRSVVDRVEATREDPQIHLAPGGVVVK